MTPSRVMDMLTRGVPLTLLIDLAESAGPDSAAINAVERPPGDPIWREAVDHRSWQQFILQAG